MLFQGEQGFIQGIEHGRVQIVFHTTDACEDCGLKVVCAPGNDRQRILSLPDPGGLSLNQSVRIEEQGNLELQLALAQFGIPLVLFLAGLFLGYYLPFSTAIPAELQAALVAFVGLLMSYPLAKHRVKQLAQRAPSHYLRIISHGSAN